MPSVQFDDPTQAAGLGNDWLRADEPLGSSSDKLFPSPAAFGVQPRPFDSAGPLEPLSSTGGLPSDPASSTLEGGLGSQGLTGLAPLPLGAPAAVIPAEGLFNPWPALGRALPSFTELGLAAEKWLLTRGPALSWGAGAFVAGLLWSPSTAEGSLDGWLQRRLNSDAPSPAALGGGDGQQFAPGPTLPPNTVSPMNPPGFHIGKEVFPAWASTPGDFLYTHPTYEGPQWDSYRFPTTPPLHWRDTLTGFPAKPIGHWSDGIYLSENQQSGEPGSIGSYSSATDWHPFVDRVFRGYYPEKELRRRDLSPDFSFRKTREDESQLGPYDYVAKTGVVYSINETFLFSQLHPDGKLSFTASALTPDVAYGSELFEGMMRTYWKHGYDPQYIAGSWSNEDPNLNSNYWRFMHNLNRGLSPEAAARETWTGREAARFGYTAVEVPGTLDQWIYDKVSPTFRRPDFGSDPAWNDYGWAWSRAIGFPRSAGPPEPAP